ncbi:MAG: sulfite exporter TauE/SafE family protein [Flavobacteriales bacterium]|nr:sulfite exporter TauE/SafE family protein [Flavobacteriales bacterium]
MDLFGAAVIALAGVVCGFINTLAGSGSLLSLPVLMYFGGMDIRMANGTNRIGILLQSAVSAGSFHKQKVLNTRQGITLALPSLAGSILGAVWAVDLNKEVLERVIGVIFIVMLFVILLKPERWLKGKDDVVSAKPGFWQMLTMFAIGVYGGFIQAGTGIFLLAGLVLSAGYDLVRANAIKVLIVFLYTPFALYVFIYNGQVEFVTGLTLAAGNMVGAWIASRMAVQKGNKFIRWILIAVVVLSAGKFLGLYQW